MKKISKDTPLSEVTLRRYEKPVNLDDREIIRKLCLSMGLLQPGDSRDIIVDILFVMLKAKQDKRLLGSEEVRDLVKDLREKEKLPLHGVAFSNVRRQLKRLRDIYIIEKVNTKYRITEFSEIAETFNYKFQSFMLNSILQRVREYAEEVDKRFIQDQ